MNQIAYYLVVDDQIIDVDSVANQLVSNLENSVFFSNFSRDHESRVCVATAKNRFGKFAAVKALTNENLDNKQFLYQLLDVAKYKQYNLESLTFLTATGKVV